MTFRVWAFIGIVALVLSVPGQLRAEDSSATKAATGDAATPPADTKAADPATPSTTTDQGKATSDNTSKTADDTTKDVKEKKKAKKKTAKTTPKKSKDVTELQKKDLKVGKGKEAKSGMKVTVHYTGWLTDGKKFDSSKDHGQPFSFTLGAHQVIEGWDKGVAGMKEGGKRRLTIPPTLGYGDRGAGDAIPPNATLIFEVELLTVEG